MARTLTRLERLDDQHARAAMRAQMVVLLRERRVLAGSIIGWVLLRRRELGRSDQLASAGELLGARGTPIGEQAVMPDAVEALGSTCMRKRRMNSPGSIVMVLYRSGPSIR